jgi:sterol desaturase/sphingolipid hydroxylase (fatty acid hydroxylase superfamily)
MQQNFNFNINYDDEPVRLFKSDFLEFFTHVHPAVVPAIWLPVGAFFLTQAFWDAGSMGTWLHIPIGFVLGVLFIWTFIEYVVHRFIFHYQPKTAWQEKLIFLFHEIHHVQPNCKTRLVMPPAVSIPGAVLFYLGFRWLIASVLGLPHWFDGIFAGFVVGYVAYDMVHYATHHLPMRGRLLKALKRHHMLHHFQDPHQRFGVTSPVWDMAFGTQPEAFLKGEQLRKV